MALYAWGLAPVPGRPRRTTRSLLFGQAAHTAFLQLRYIPPQLLWLDDCPRYLMEPLQVSQAREHQM